ncbi:MAG: biotin carboxylase, partial [Ferruginibacter sp.]
TIPIYYDPMIAKLVTHGTDRKDAIQKMKTAITNYTITGVSTTLPFGKFVFEHEAFLSGKFDTHFVKDHYTPEKLKAKQKQNAVLASAIALKYWLNTQKETRAVDSITSNWKRRRL